MVLWYVYIADRITKSQGIFKYRLPIENEGLSLDGLWMWVSPHSKHIISPDWYNKWFWGKNLPLFLNSTDLVIWTDRMVQVRQRWTFIFSFDLPADPRRINHGETFPSDRLGTVYTAFTSLCSCVYLPWSGEDIYCLTVKRIVSVVVES